MQDNQIQNVEVTQVENQEEVMATAEVAEEGSESTGQSKADEASESITVEVPESDNGDGSDVHESAKAKEQVRIEFPYSEIIREKAPKAFEVAEKVATDWKNEGDFTDLGISHPLAGIVASQALTKAKEVEKKLEEKGVFSIAKLGLEIAKSQVENIKSKISK